MAPRRNPMRRVALVGATVFLAGCGSLPRFGAPDAASSEGRRVQHLWSGFFVAAIVVVLTVWVPLTIALIRNRRRKHQDPNVLPSQKAYNIPVEVGYTLVPILTVAVLFMLSIGVENKVNAVADRPVARVEVVGFQWGWQFRYAGENFTIDAPPGGQPELVLPVGAPSNLRLVSNDVNHSFWVPDFLTKRDLIPGIRNVITVRPTRLGTYKGRCAEFCGLDHWRMDFTVRVVPMDQYRTWVAQHRGKGTGT
jgi:cytochrome c oxidase subunit 2